MAAASEDAAKKSSESEDPLAKITGIKWQTLGWGGDDEAEWHHLTLEADRTVTLLKCKETRGCETAETLKGTFEVSETHVLCTFTETTSDIKIGLPKKEQYSISSFNDWNYKKVRG